MKKVLALLLFISFHLGLGAQCSVPSNFTAQNISTTSIDIDLSASGSGPWEIEYGLTGFMVGTGTRITVTANQPSITGLAPATAYRVHIRRKCGAQTSAWASFSFTTACNTTFNAPVTFNFESPAWQSPTTTNGTGTLGNCWIVSPQATQTFWSVGPPHNTRLNTGPLGDHSSGFGKYLHLNALSVSQDSISTIQSPAIDLSGVAQPQLEFWYHLFGAEIDSLELMARYNSALDWDTIYTFQGPQQSVQEDPWLKLNLSLSAYADSTVYFQFVGYGDGDEVQMAIDDLSVYDSLACRPSTYFHQVSTDDQSVLLDWDPGTGGSHQIEYGAPGFSIGSGTRLNVGAPPYRISGLNSNTTYEFYLRDLCGNQFSNWTPVLKVNTDCSPIMAPYQEDFEAAAWPNGGLEACWDRWDLHDFKWEVGPPSLNYTQSGPGPNQRSGSTKYLVADRPNQKGDPRSSLVTPLIDLDTINNPEIKFWRHMFGLQITAFEVSIDSGDGYHLLKRIIGAQQNAKTDPWEEEILAIPNYSGKQVKVKFTAIASRNWASLARIAIDDFSIGQSPGCRKPTDLALQNVRFTTATVDWLSGGATDWIYKIQASGGVPFIGPTSSNPLYLSNLQPGTEYTIWLRDSCGLADVSAWSAPLSFKTACLPDSAPYFEDFEGSTFVVQSSWFSPGSLDPCWQRSHEVGPMWQPSPATIFPNNLLPTSDHTTGSGKYMGGTLFLGNGSNEPTYFTSPHIDLSALIRPELSFWYFLGGYSWSTNQIELEVNDGSGWQSLTSIYGPQQLSTSAAWLEEIVDLSAFKDDTIQLRFSSQGNNLYAATAGGIDDISIYDNPDCNEPSDLRAFRINSSSAALSWTSGGASQWNLRFRERGASFQHLNPAVNDTFLLSGLQPGTSYEVWVRDSCNPDVSFWHGPLYFITDCNPSNVPYYESFDGQQWSLSSAPTDPGAIDLCWRRSDSTTKVWLPGNGSTSPFSGPAGTRSGNGHYLFTEILASPPANYSEPLELSSLVILNSGLQQPELNYWYHLYGPQIQSLKVYLEFGDDSRILIDSLIGAQQNNATAAWQQNSVSLAAFQGDTFKVVFVADIGNSPARGNIALDDVEIIDANCSPPQGLSANNITATAANLNWSSVSARSTIEFGLSGFSQGNGSSISAVQPGYRLSGLQPFTSYDFYVQDSCRTTNSNWTGPYTFTTTCSAPRADFREQGSTLSLSFNATPSLGIGLQYAWDFGDGSNGQGLNPRHTYASAGFYNVQLIITDTCGQSDTLIKNIQVCAAPQAQIQYQVQGLQVFLDGRSSSQASQYYWDLGPAGIFNQDSLSITFPAKGIYPIYLVVSNACGGTDTSFLDLVICDKPTASFTRTINVFNGVMQVNFDGTASIFADRYRWDFGDGSSDTTSLTPTHTYPTTSLNYMVRLIVWADCGLSDTLAYPLSGMISSQAETLNPIAVYPNPSDERLMIYSPEQALDPQEMSCYDLSGKAYSLPLLRQEETLLEFDVSALASGEYLLMLDPAQNQTVKIVVR